MREWLPFVIVGLTTGSVYGLAGIGLVLTFRTAGVLNLAHGAIAAAATYAFYDLHISLGLPWPLVTLICVGVLGGLAGLAVERLGRGLTDARPVMTIVATLGLLLAVQGFITWRYTASAQLFPRFLPDGGIYLLDVRIQWSQLITFAVGLGATAGLYVFLSATRLGMAMRGVVDDASLLAMSGTRPARVRAVSWMVGCAFASLSGILVGPQVGRDPYVLTLLVVQACGAAALGAFSSLPLTYAGGLALGIAASFTTKLVGTNEALRGLPVALPFIMLFLALLLTGGRRLALPPTRRVRLAVRRRPNRGRERGVAAVVLAVLLAVPQLVGPRLPVYINMLVFVLIFLSLAILVWTSNQISLCHSLFAALGATTFSHLTTGAGVPWLPALFLAALAVVPLGAFVALPAIRLSGIYLALATFGFGLLVQQAVFRLGVMFGEEGYRTAPRPEIPGLGGRTDTEFYYVVLAIVVAACLLVTLLSRSRLGRLLRGMADSPVALVSIGVNANVTRLLVFCVSAFLAGVAGCLIISNSGTVSGIGLGPFDSLIWLGVLAICGTSLVPSSLCAAAVLAVLPSYLPTGYTDVQTMLFGVAAMTAAVLSGRRFRWRFLATDDNGVRSPVRDRWIEVTARERRQPERQLAEAGR